MRSDDVVPESADLPPRVSFEDEFARWAALARGEGGPLQHPADELLAEHHMIGAALIAMSAEAHRLERRDVLRVEVWADLVDFFGNFVHLVHRRKEALGSMPALEIDEALQTHLRTAEEEHGLIANLTVVLVDGLNEGDWEKVLRTARQYVYVAVRHLRGEEAALLPALRANLSTPQLDALRAEFDRLEAVGLGGRDRRYYLELIQRIARRAGLPDVG